LAMNAERTQGEVVNVACGRRVSLNQLLKILQDIIGSHVSLLYEEPRKGEPRHSLADIKRGKTILNYDPRVGIEEGLRRTVEFFKNMK
ncbi:MAG: LPS biosynthesis protein WbpP, partial [Deltaproteobacteria bacterium]|nr:LPS biosynthesis protein WbpP [Deltaproteobacteria bacterium]